MNHQRSANQRNPPACLHDYKICVTQPPNLRLHSRLTRWPVELQGGLMGCIASGRTSQDFAQNLLLKRTNSKKQARSQRGDSKKEELLGIRQLIEGDKEKREPELSFFVEQMGLEVCRRPSRQPAHLDHLLQRKKKEPELFLFLWSRWDSNPLPFDCEPNALPDELLPRFVIKKGRCSDPSGGSISK